MTAPLAVHGGDLAAIGRAHGVDPGALLDFSSNVNPLGPPAALLAALARAAADVACLARYPEPDAATLRAALAARDGVDPEAIVVGNGAAALLGVALACGGAGGGPVRRCAVPVPAFSEYAHALAGLGAALVPVPLDESRAFALPCDRVAETVRALRCDAVVVTNPHNPSGALASAPEVRALATRCVAAGALVVADEAFVDYAPGASIARHAASTPGVVAVRSLTKFFAVPALRVGYALAHPDHARAMRARLPSWPVSTPEAAALAAAVADAAYARATLAANAAARTELVAELGSLGFVVVAPAANFVLARLPEGAPSAAAVTRALVERDGVVVRDCTSYAGLGAGRHIRVAVRLPAENARLVAALARALDQEPRPSEATNAT